MRVRHSLGRQQASFLDLEPQEMTAPALKIREKEVCTHSRDGRERGCQSHAEGGGDGQPTEDEQVDVFLGDLVRSIQKVHLARLALNKAQISWVTGGETSAGGGGAEWVSHLSECDRCGLKDETNLPLDVDKPKDAVPLANLHKHKQSERSDQRLDGRDGRMIAKAGDERRANLLDEDEISERRRHASLSAGKQKIERNACASDPRRVGGGTVNLTLAGLASSGLTG